jgi:hypothetical protein
MNNQHARQRKARKRRRCSDDLLVMRVRGGRRHICVDVIDARVIGVHRISSNNALAWHYAMMMSVMMKNNDDTAEHTSRTAAAADRQQQRGRADLCTTVVRRSSAGVGLLLRSLST